MYTRLSICDICRADGEIRLAKIAYFGDERRVYHACSTHTEDVIRLEIEIIKEFEEKGDASDEVYDA